MNDKRKFRTTMIVILSVLVVLACVFFFLFDPRGIVRGMGQSWSLGNFALMDIVIFECFMLLIGGYITTTRKERRQEEEETIDVKWLPRLLSIPVMLVTLIIFVFVENVDLLPLVFFDQWTWAFVALTIIQTVLVALSKKKYNEPEDSGSDLDQ